MSKGEGFELERRRYRDRHGQEREAGRYTVRFTDHVGARRRITAFTDERASATFGRHLRELVDRRAMGERLDAELSRWLDGQAPAVLDKLSAWGLIDPTVTAARQPLDELLDEWRAAMLANGRTEKHARHSVQRVRRIVDGIGAMWFADLNAERVSAFLAVVQVSRRPDGKNARPLSAQSRKHHIRAAKAFGAWMARTGRASSSPLDGLAAPNADADRRYERRALSIDELRRLVETTRKAGEPWRGTTGPERATLYALAATTGLRVAELRSLRVGAFDLNGDAPAVTVEAKAAKNRKRAEQPLTPDVVALLREAFRGKLPGARAFTVPDRTADMLGRDLDAARAAYVEDGSSPKERAKRAESDFLARVDANGHVVDLHALRVTFVTLLARGGVHPSTAQRLARHSDIRLTMETYTRLDRDDEHRAALGALPSIDAHARAGVVQDARTIGPDAGTVVA